MSSDGIHTEIANPMKNFLCRGWVRADEIAVACLDRWILLVTYAVHMVRIYLEETISSSKELERHRYDEVMISFTFGITPGGMM
jgi:hypothetical protein